jgi:uncharacterized protein YndB with AHSA1/START domain
MEQKQITIETTVDAPLEKVWESWILPEHINEWAFASDDWGATAEENDVRTGGRFKTVMFAKDKSTSFDFAGEYTEVKEHARIEYTMDDGRQVEIDFEETPDGVHITQSFDPENENPIEVQRDGWQAILDNFKKYVESR